MHATHGGYRAGSFIDGTWWKLRLSDKPTRDLPRDIANITGYYIDDYADQTYQPIVVRLPHGRLLAGYTMGEGMSTSFDASEVFIDEREAWMHAHEIADWDAMLEREYQASRCTECHDNEKRGAGELPDLCESCYAESGARTLALHATE